MGSFGSTVITMVKGHVPNIITSLLKIIFYPLLLLEAIGQNISKKSLPGRYIDADHKNISNKLKIYQQCTKNLINIDASFLKDYYSENLYKFLAALLQVVSFFTTYAGVELFFGDLFSLSTLFITLVIQIGLFVTSINSNKPGKRNFRDKFLMTILLIVSIAFSYIGLITHVSSPEEDYEQAYKSYKTTYDKVVNNLDSLSDEQIESSIKNHLGNVIATLKLFDRKILDNIVQRQNLEKSGRPEEQYISKVGGESIGPDGTITREGNTFKENPSYEKYVKSNAICLLPISGIRILLWNKASGMGK